MRFLLSLLLLLTVSFAAAAQTPAPAADPATAEIAVTPENITNLIKTLESETARNEFIGNLKTMAEVQGEKAAAAEPAAPVAITEQIGLENQTKTMLAQYHEFLAKNNLNATKVGKWMMTAGAVIVGFLLIFIMRKISSWLRRKAALASGRFKLHNNKRLRWYARLVKYYGYYLILTLFLYALSIIWDFSDSAFFTHPMASAVFFGLMNIVVVFLIAALIGELINGSIEYAMYKASNANAQRVRTLLPIIRTIIFTVFFVLCFLVLLSELGINVLPLLAGAGVVGVAVGLGAQKFLQDFLTGFTIILENIFQIGDVVNLGGQSGVVESITMRKVQLRAYSGSVFTIPFSEIRVIENLTKDFSFYPIDLSISYVQDADRIVALMKEASAELRQQDDFKDVILDDIEIAGVDRLAETSFVIKARIKTRPGQQWPVGRAFNGRLKHLFDKHGIDIPVAQQTLVMAPERTAKIAVDRPEAEPNKNHQTQE